MRPHFSPLLAGVAVAGHFLVANLHADGTTKPKPAPAGSQDEAECSTLSELGIDFGAAELERFTKLGLADKQKREALRVVKSCKPRIDKLCARMEVALKMDETNTDKKRLKEVELAAMVEKFKGVQEEIMTGLHALLTREQVAKLDAIKKREREEAAKKKGDQKEAKPASEAEAA